VAILHSTQDDDAEHETSARQRAWVRVQPALRIGGHALNAVACTGGFNISLQREKQWLLFNLSVWAASSSKTRGNSEDQLTLNWYRSCSGSSH
jgi:hypothetical protein